MVWSEERHQTRHQIVQKGEMLPFDLVQWVYRHRMEVAGVACHVLAHCHAFVAEDGQQHSVATELGPELETGSALAADRKESGEMDLELNQMPVTEKVAVHIADMAAASVVRQDVGDQCTPAEEFEDIYEDAGQEGRPGFGFDSA